MKQNKKEREEEPPFGVAEYIIVGLATLGIGLIIFWIIAKDKEELKKRHDRREQLLRRSN
eukprot:TRINITY_DN3364_c0_g1_i1.p2 TRINITY_DN3364_c0_g1~~TRINITY_DN3364_c0_g1_i1.p2  ORF type:complete len:60 (-),score=10.97 TRINITY_DN3364_c0_g1_i1:113-292(-)